MSDNYEEHLHTVQARGLYANYTMTMVAIGINIFMSLYGLSVFLETPLPQRKGRKRYIAASFTITVLFSICGSLDMANFFQALFKSTSPGNWKELMRSIFFEDRKFLVGYILLGLLIAIGDGLLVYRCYIVCVDYWWVTILPMAASLSALALHLTSVSQPYSDISYSASAASTFLTVSTNVCVTGFISFRLLRARRTLAKVLPSADVRLYTSVIAILIESAAPLTIFGIITAVLQQLTSSGNLSPGLYICSDVVSVLFYSFCALSPHMIIFRVTTGRSFTRFPTPKDGVLSDPIQFCHQTAESSFLQTTFNREFAGGNPDPDTEQGTKSSVDEFHQSRTSVVHAAQEKRGDGPQVKTAE